MGLINARDAPGADHRRAQTSPMSIPLRPPRSGPPGPAAQVRRPKSGGPSPAARGGDCPVRPVGSLDPAVSFRSECPVRGSRAQRQRCKKMGWPDRSVLTNPSQACDAARRRKCPVFRHSGASAAPVSVISGRAARPHSEQIRKNKILSNTHLRGRFRVAVNYFIYKIFRPKLITAGVRPAGTAWEAGQRPEWRLDVETA